MLGIGLGIPFSQKRTIIVQDTFNRADNASILGSANTGQAWEVLAGTWGISGNAAYISALAAGNAAVIESGKSDVTIRYTASVLAEYQRFIFRISDTSDYLFVQFFSSNYRLYKVVAGVVTELAATPGGASGDKIMVRALGSGITVYRNGSQIINVTESHNQSATKHGIGGANQASALNARFDDFRVEVI